MSEFTAVEESEATGEVAELYEDIQRGYGIPFVPNISKTLAISPAVLKGYWEASKNIFLNT